MAVSPVLLTTWPFGKEAAETGIAHLQQGMSALDAVELAANVTELDPTASSVGYGGLPDASGTITLDAAIMDGVSHAAGAVAGLTRIRRAISVARQVMEKTPHVMLVGDMAREFALSRGFPEETLDTDFTRARYVEWLGRRTGPDVAHFTHGTASPSHTPDNHDTIGLCALDSNGNLAVGCTTSGMAWKLPGRVGDSPIIGSGLYVDNAVGAAAGTGHGDEMMKACLSYRVVMNMERGMLPTEACEEALRYLLRKRPPEQYHHYGAALIALRRDGLFGAAASQSGFRPPTYSWEWFSATTEGITYHEGPYVSA